MKRPAEFNNGPTLKKLKTSEEQEIVTKMSCEDTLQKDNFDMVAMEVVSSNVDHVPMVSDSADVSLEETSNPTFSQIGKQNNEQSVLDSSKNLDYCDNSLMDKPPSDNKDQKGNLASPLISNVIENELADKCNQQPVGLLLQDLGNTFSASRNPNQGLFGMQLENVVTNKCNKDMMLECYKRKGIQSGITKQQEAVCVVKDFQ
ncbi:hypothetical protein LSTR_LSTR017166 [Laodelphax striatellus]|uniref:Uncharacterized protein n=1 Tax=Laodelphax striatellus TaxID=195883 RepID=A0A482WML5_LAOST|nr:hypothetical protein LSTR_LSTR017166 [Laodelphax striatellus]